MATRLYFSTGHAADLSLTRPLPGGGIWESNIGSLPTTRKLSLAARGTTNNAAAPYGTAMTAGNGTNPNDVLLFQGISEPLAAQTISGTVLGVANFRETNGAMNAYTNLGVFVVDKDGTRVATLYGGATSGGTEINNPSANNRNIPRGGSAAITSYDCAAGDRIVVEVGIRVETTNTTYQIIAFIGDPGGSDLPSGNGTSNNNTINPWIEFSADLQFGNGGTFALDAFIKAVRTSSFTLDAYILSGDRFFELDAIISAPQSGSFVLDSITSRSMPGSFTLDAYTSVRHTGSFTLDAIIQDTPALIIDDPFDDPDTVAGEWTPRWVLIKGIENSTAEHGRTPGKGAFIYDNSSTVLDSERGGYVGKGGFRKGVFTAKVKLAQVSDQLANNVRYAVYLRHSGETQGIGYYTATYVAIELIMQVGGAMALQVRSNYQTVEVSPVGLTAILGTWSDGDQFYIKGWAKGERFKGKVWRVGDPEPRWQINQIISGMPTIGYKGMAANTSTSWKPVEWNVRQAWVYNLDWSVDLDAVIRAVPTGSFALDAIVKGPRSGSFTLDARITDPSAEGDSFTLDAIVSKPAEGSFTLDAVARRTAVLAFALGSVLRGGRSGSLTLDAITRATRSAGFTLDAWNRKSFQSSFTLDAVGLATRTVGFTLDAAFLSPNDLSFTLDARIVARVEQAVDLDAVLRRGVGGSFALDATLLKTGAASWTLDAIARATRTEQVTLDASLVRVASGTIPVDSVIRRNQSASFVLDAVVTIIRTTEPVATLVVHAIAGTIGAPGHIGATIEAHAFTSRLGRTTRTGSFTLSAEIA